MSAKLRSVESSARLDSEDDRDTINTSVSFELLENKEVFFHVLFVKD